MGRKQHHLTIQVPIPANLPPESIVHALHQYTPVLRNQALVTRYQQARLELDDVLTDPFFREDGTQIVCYQAFEKITIVPHVVSKEINFPVVMQRFQDGLRFRTNAPADVVLWGDYKVQRKDVSSGGGSEEEKSRSRTSFKDEGSDGPWEVVEQITVECNSLMMPFVKGQMEGAHRELCEKIVEEVQREQSTT